MEERKKFKCTQTARANIINNFNAANWKRLWWLDGIMQYYLCEYTLTSLISIVCIRRYWRKRRLYIYAKQKQLALQVTSDTSDASLYWITFNYTFMIVYFATLFDFLHEVHNHRRRKKIRKSFCCLIYTSHSSFFLLLIWN